MSSAGWLGVSAGLVGFVLLCALALWAWRRWSTKNRRKKPSFGLRYPVVLVHGVMGFDALKVAGQRTEYFRGFAEMGRKLGVDVVAVRLHPTAKVAVRAAELAKAVGALPFKRVNIIGHSMGGVDARYAITQLGLHKRTASLTTIGTPHRGTPLADLGTGLGDVLGVARLFRALRDIDGFYDLTTTRMAAFNANTHDHGSVHYGSVVGAVTKAHSPLLLPSFRYLSRSSGPNDGLVPVSSQSWGEVLATIDADHWAQIGWSRRFDAAAFFESLLTELRGRGL